MKARLAGFFVLTAGAALAFPNPDSGCSITTAGVLPEAVKNEPINYTIVTSGCTAPIRRMELATGTLPDGLRISGTTLAGAPTTPGVYAFALRVYDANYRIPSKSFVIRVNDPLRIDTPAAATGQSGAAYSDRIRARGGVAPYTFSVVEGALPAGLTLTPATGAISGTMPAAGSQFRIRVTDSSTPAVTAEKSYTIVAGGQITTLTPPPPGTVGTAGYSFDIDGSLGASGFALALGALPGGLTMNGDGVISGTPTAAGEFHFTVRQTAGTASVWRSYRILVNTAGTVSGTPRNAEETFAYDHVFTASGGVGPYTYSVSAGALPTGITLDAATGALLGELPLSGAGTAFTISAIDQSGRTYSQAFSITAVTRLQGAETSPPTVKVNQNVNNVAMYGLSQGGTGKGFAQIGGQAQGFLALDEMTGQVSYTVPTPGVFVPVVEGFDALGGAVIFKTAALNVVGALAIGSATELPNPRSGVPYNGQVTVVNGNFTPLTFAVTGGTLPVGLELNPSTGAITGTPEATPGTTSTFTIGVTDALAQSASRTYTVGVGGNLAITTTFVPGATIASVYGVQLAAVGSASPAWTNPGGGLPTGITLSPGGLLSGTPTVTGSFTFLVQATLAASNESDTKQFTIHVANGLTAGIAPASPLRVNAGGGGSATVTPSGGRAPFTLSITGGTLPEGMYVQNTTPASIEGIAQVAGTSAFTILVTDADGRNTTIPYTIEVRDPVRQTTESLDAGTRTVAYSQTLTAADGLGPYLWALGEGGGLPPGLTLSTAGVLSGTPTVNGSFAFSAVVT